MSSPATTAWAAPRATSPVRGRVRLPGSKSLTNRALLLAALAERPSRVSQPLVARDTELMMAGLRALGAGIELHGDVAVVTPGRLHGPAQIDCGLAGTVMRFLPPVAALASGPVAFDGDPRARERPMGAMLAALRDLGVSIPAGADRLPFTVDGTGTVDGGVVTLDASQSSQFVSALLLAGARYESGVDVRHDGKPVPSMPHIRMTIEMLRARGVGVDDSEPNRWVVRPGPIDAHDVTVEPDLSNAAPFVAAAVVAGGEVTVLDWPCRTSQAGDQLRDILTTFGATVSLDTGGLVVTGDGSLRGADLDLHEVGELTPVVAALAALADSPSHLRGIAHLRGHETDRLAALAAEISGLGGDVRETHDGLEIRPAPLTGGTFRTYADHRMAQAAAVLGLVIDDVLLDDVACTDKTHPDFVAAWTALLA